MLSIIMHNITFYINSFKIFILFIQVQNLTGIYSFKLLSLLKAAEDKKFNLLI